MFKTCTTLAATVLLTLLLAAPSLAAEGATPLRVACAANFTAPMKQLAKLYHEQADVPVDPVFGSTGMLYGQIVEGAPFDVFFAADTKRPALLVDQDLARTPVTYARGKAVFWSARAEVADADGWTAAATADVMQRIGLANPKTAPYGAAAVAAMRAAGVYEALEPKLVYGKNVGQAFQFAETRSADGAFVALSQALSEDGRKGAHWILDGAPLIEQAACVLSGAVPEAEAFLEFVLTDPDARAVIAAYGYE